MVSAYELPDEVWLVMGFGVTSIVDNEQKAKETVERLKDGYPIHDSTAKYARYIRAEERDGG